VDEVAGKTDRLIRWSSVVTCGNPNIAADVRARERESDRRSDGRSTRLFHPRGNGERRAA
jgi:hypothetical protein